MIMQTIYPLVVRCMQISMYNCTGEVIVTANYSVHLSWNLSLVRPQLCIWEIGDSVRIEKNVTGMTYANYRGFIYTSSFSLPGTLRPVNICFTGTQPDDDVRLIGPSNMKGVGVVQLRRNGIWGGVCDNGWDLSDARVVCRMLCFE